MLKASRGSSLLEVLVAMLLLSLGILSMGAMHARAAQATRTGQHVAIASQLAVDLAERMRANGAAARQGAYDVNASGGLAGSSSPAQSGCMTTSCAPSELAAEDLAQWSRAAAEQLPQAGVVARRDDDEIPAMNVWIVWREPRAVSAASDVGGNASAVVPSVARQCPSGIDLGATDPPQCLYLKVSL